MHVAAAAANAPRVLGISVAILESPFKELGSCSLNSQLTLGQSLVSDAVILR